jgi:phosphoenolpyruvate synthase/pyruvate phosphate dikinase
VGSSLNRTKIIEDIAYSVVDMYLKNHAFSVLDNRLLSNFKGELDATSVLRDVWLEQMGGSPEKLIALYEKTNDRNGTLNYENLIDSNLVSFAAEFFVALLAGILVEEYARNHDKIISTIKRLYRKPLKETVKVAEDVTSKDNKSITYLFQVYALKLYCEKKKSSQADFIRLRESIRRMVYSGSKEKLPDDFVRFHKAFLENHLLPTLEQDYAKKMGTEFVISSIETNFDTYAKDITSGKIKTGTSIEIDFETNADAPILEKKLSGISAGKRGIGVGKVAIVLEESDCEKVKKGDVMVIEEMCPDFVPAARRAVALVSDLGGIVSHTAIIGRELNLPTVVGTEKATEILADGMIVHVNSIHGNVYAQVP